MLRRPTARAALHFYAICVLFFLCFAVSYSGELSALDWTLLAGIDAGVPFMLSGGLDAGNVAEALRITHAPGVDVSSGVESAPGEKDPARIREFVHAARAAQEPLDLSKAVIG